MTQRHRETGIDRQTERRTGRDKETDRHKYNGLKHNMLTDRQIDRNTIDRNTTKYYINAQWQFPLPYAQFAAHTTYLLSFQFYLAKAVQKKPIS